MRLARLLYIAGLSLWLSFTLVYPWWTVSRYGQESWTRGPLWNPPRELIDRDGVSSMAHVRWPWQFYNWDQPVYVELGTDLMRAQASVGVMLLGLVAGWFRPAGTPDRLLHVAFSVALSLVITWIAFLAVAAITLGLAATPEIIGGAVSAGVVFGLIYGMATYAKAERSARFASSTSAVEARGVALQPRRAGAGLMWFAVGVLVAFAITVALVALNFVDPPPPRGEWGLRGFHWWVSPAIGIAGWSLGLGLWLLGQRPLATGIAIGATGFALLILNA